MLSVLLNKSGAETNKVLQRYCRLKNGNTNRAVATEKLANTLTKGLFLTELDNTGVVKKGMYVLVGGLVVFMTSNYRHEGYRTQGRMLSVGSF